MSETSTKNKLSEKLKGKNPKSGVGSLLHAKVIYDYSVDGGAAAAITPKQNVELPAKAVIVGGTIVCTAAVTSSGGANVTIGTSAGSSASSLLGSTAKGSLTLGAVLNAVPVFATPVVLSAKGKVTITPDAILTAGIVEVNLFYFVTK
jgi:hypothetical protein